MAEITQTISVLPESPKRLIDNEDVFVQKAEALFDAYESMRTEYNTLGSQVESVKDEVNTARDTVVAKEALMNPHYDDIDTVSTNIAKVGTVADNIAKVDTVHTNIVKVGTVADNIAKVGTVADNIVKVGTVADNIVDIQNAEENATLAINAKNDAELAYANTVQTANVSKWVSGTSYLEGNNVWSPIDFKTYRAKANTSGTTDPSLDNTNWERLGGDSTKEITFIPSITSAVTTLPDGNYVTKFTTNAPQILNQEGHLRFPNTSNRERVEFSISGDSISSVAYGSNSATSDTLVYSANATFTADNAQSSIISTLINPDGLSYQNGVLEKIDESHILNVYHHNETYAKVQVLELTETDPRLAVIETATPFVGIGTVTDVQVPSLVKSANGVYLLTQQITAGGVKSLYAQTIIINPDYTITMGSVVVVNTEILTYYNAWQVKDNTFMLKYDVTTYNKIVALSVDSSGVITVGTPFQHTTSGNLYNGLLGNVSKVGTTEYYVTSFATSSSASQLVIYQLSGLTISQISSTEVGYDAISGGEFYNYTTDTIIGHLTRSITSHKAIKLVFNTSNGSYTKTEVTSTTAKIGVDNFFKPFECNGKIFFSNGSVSITASTLAYYNVSATLMTVGKRIDNPLRLVVFTFGTQALPYSQYCFYTNSLNSTISTPAVVFRSYTETTAPHTNALSMMSGKYIVSSYAVSGRINFYVSATTKPIGWER